MPVPQDGMTVQEAEQLQLTAAKTVYGDLVEKGIASIQSIIWEGEFNTKDPSNIFIIIAPCSLRAMPRCVCPPARAKP